MAAVVSGTMLYAVERHSLGTWVVRARMDKRSSHGGLGCCRVGACHHGPEDGRQVTVPKDQYLAILTPKS